MGARDVTLALQRVRSTVALGSKALSQHSETAGIREHYSTSATVYHDLPFIQPTLEVGPGPIIGFISIRDTCYMPLSLSLDLPLTARCAEYEW